MRLINDLEREANSLSRGTRQASALGLEGRPPGGEFNQKILRGKPTRCCVMPGSQRSWVGGGTPAPQELSVKHD